MQYMAFLQIKDQCVIMQGNDPLRPEEHLGNRDIGGQLHGLLDALRKFFQGFLRILADQVHHAHGVLVGLAPDDRKARHKDGQYAREDRKNGDGRDLDADRMH